jgi:hypothetical protein
VRPLSIAVWKSYFRLKSNLGKFSEFRSGCRRLAKVQTNVVLTNVVLKNVVLAYVVLTKVGPPDFTILHSDQVQWAPLNGITDNRINRILGSI